jgi:hypothetical protein
VVWSSPNGVPSFMVISMNPDESGDGMFPTHFETTTHVHTIHWSENRLSLGLSSYSPTCLDKNVYTL